MNAAIAIAIDKTCAMGLLRRPYAGGEHDELGLVHRVADQALLLEPVQRIPIKPLPGPPVVMAGQKEERQHRVVDLVRVTTPSAATKPINPVRVMSHPGWAALVLRPPFIHRPTVS